MRLIVVDDDRDTVATLKAILEDAGHVVRAVHSGNEVLPNARLVRPDAIVLDISLPGMSGYAVAQVIRNSFLEARRPLLIAISGKWMEAPDRLLARQVGFDHYLEKPCDPQAILDLLDTLTLPDPGLQ